MFNSFSVVGIIGYGWMVAVGNGGAAGVRKAVGRVNSYRSIVMKPARSGFPAFLAQRASVAYGTWQREGFHWLRVVPGEEFLDLLFFGRLSDWSCGRFYLTRLGLPNCNRFVPNAG